VTLNDFQQPFKVVQRLRIFSHCCL